MRNNPVSGAIFMLRGLSLIARPSVRKFVVIPLAINIVLFGSLIWFGADQFDAMMDRLLPPDWALLRYLLWPIFAVSVLVLGFYTFTLIGNLVAAPFNGMLAEAVERELTGRPVDGPTGLKSIAKDVASSLASEVRKLAYVLKFMVPLALLFLIPVINLAAPFLWLAFSAWMLAISYADFPMGNHGLRFHEIRARLSERRLLTLGFGGAVMVGIMIPFLNLLMIPAAVAGATAMWVDELSQDGA
ncbi:MAG: sulfate transporter CysZ [Gammaproteobacteria bacterium]|nr:sulfate transporter CysZ [Gammaproteobacteria bacterium]